MSKQLKLSPQLRIRACDRILRRLYKALKVSMKCPASPETLNDEDNIHGNINYWKECKERIEISL